MEPSTAVIRRRGTRLVIVVALALIGLMTHGTHAGTGDEPHYLAIAHSLAFDGDLDLSNNYGANEPLIAGGGLQPEQHVEPGVDGVIRPLHDIGLPLVFVPLVRVAAPLVASIAPGLPAPLMRRLHLSPSVIYRHVLSLAMIALACVLATFIFRALLALDASPAEAFWAALIVLLSPPLLIFSILFFTELLTALLTFIAFYGIVFRSATRSNLVWAAIGAINGFLLFVHIRNIAIAGALGVLATALFWHGRRFRTLGIYAAAFAVPALARTFLVHHLWGTWIATPIAHAGRFSGAAVLTVAGRRIAAMSLDQEYGLLPYAPIFLLACAGIVWLRRDHRPVMLQVCFVSCAYVASLALPMTNAIGWTGGWSPPARFLTPVIPLIAIGMATGMRRAPRLITVPLIVVQIAIDGYFWQHPKYLWNNGTGVAAVCTEGGVPICGLLPSFDPEAPRQGGHER
jgi:hypothetical protein